MRVLLFAGKGGVGKTSIAAATALAAAKRGYRTIIISLDSAHNLSDVFEVSEGLFKVKGRPYKVRENLWLQEIDVLEEIQRHWKDVHDYIAALFRASGIREILAEELAILPGMEEVSGLLYLNGYAKKGLYDLIVLDCAPTGEAIRFVSLPTILEWYMRKFFNLERKLAKVVGPFVERLYDVPMPEDRYFEAIESLFRRLEGVEKLLSNPRVTTVRLVTNPEKIVMKETQRAFLYFSLYGLCVDGVVINKVFPPSPRNQFLKGWRSLQEGYISEFEKYFSPVPILQLPLYEQEVRGMKSLERLAEDLYGGRNPLEVFHRDPPYHLTKVDGRYELRVQLPFVEKGEINLSKKGDELIIKVGVFRRHVLLPKRMAVFEPQKAKIEGKVLIITFGGREDGKKKRS
ncbi:MAG: ArsA family ATPase [Deltaproteobacteria bacterium]|nr:MAG: ArsA family ATPase [Deltaproteobacteria bacterium]